ESYMVVHAMRNPVEYGQRHRHKMSQLIDTANLALLPFDRAKLRIEDALASQNPMMRYWGVMVCTSFGEAAASLADDVLPLLKDDSDVVRIRAAEFLGLIDKADPRKTLIEVVNTTKNPIVATEALNSVVWFRDFFGDRYKMRRSDFHPVSKGDGVTRRLAYINGAPYPTKKKAKPAKRPSVGAAN
ncbi:MAG: HEAT repeat domain-containing protein, partial [Pirellulales bacterium]|nr:HEAT repeat domain-containing protein [Pirellulales bacterium]